MTTRVVLESKLDSAQAEELRKTFLKVTQDDIVMDGSGVEQFGALSLELILSARHLWARNGKTVTLENPSEQMIDDLGRLGLTAADLQGRPE